MIAGIKSVDFLITATGEGVVNHNGSFPAYNPAAGTVLKNHMFPKMRKVDPMKRLGKLPDGSGGVAIRLDDKELDQASLIVSSECARAGMFRDISFGLARVTVNNVEDILASLHGLVRGYLITEGGRNFARKSPLYVTDFDCANPGFVYNQGTNSKARGTAEEKTSIYSYFKTNKDLVYTAKASLSIEDLQFIPLENSLGRSAYDHQVSIAAGEALAEQITQFLVDIAEPGLSPVAEFVKKAVRKNSVAKVGDSGICLNQDAMRVVVMQVIDMVKSLSIRQGKGYMQVTDVVVDFNDSMRVFRCAVSELGTDSQGEGSFAEYYERHDMTDVEYSKLQAERKKLMDMKEAEKDARKIAREANKAAKKAKQLTALEAA